MPLPSSGPISLGNIQTEFGGTAPTSLSEYYAGGTYVPGGTAGVPSSGNISLSNFRNASSSSYQITAINGASTNENAIYSFIVSTTGLSTGTNVYWLLSGLQGVDYTANIANYGSLKTVANTTLGSLQNANTKVDGYSYGSIVNNLYLRRLGRYPESVGVVETLVTQLVNGSITVEALESDIANSPEATAIPAAPNGITQTFANGNAIISGYVVNDFRYEGTEVANLVVFSNAVNGTEVARYQFSVVDTSSGILDIFGVLNEIVEGTSTNISLYNIGSIFVNSNVQVKLIPSLDGGTPAIIGSDITINGGTQANVFVATGNATITTFTLSANNNIIVGGVHKEYYVRAYTATNQLIASTGNMKIVSGTTTSTTTESPGTTSSTTTTTTTESPGTTSSTTTTTESPGTTSSTTTTTESPGTTSSTTTTTESPGTTSSTTTTTRAQVSTTFNLLSPVDSGDAIIGAFTTTVADRAYIRRQDPGPTYVDVYGSSASPITVTPGALNSGINLGTADYATMGGSVNYLLTVFLASNPSNTNTQTRTLTINAPTSVQYRFDLINSSMTENTAQDVTIVSPSTNTGPFTISVASGPGQVKPYGSGTYGSSVSVTTSVPSGEPEATGQFTLQATGTGSIVLNYFNGATLVNTSTVTALASGATTTTTTTTAAPTTSTTTTTVAPSANISAINGGTSGMYTVTTDNIPNNVYLYFQPNGTLYSRDATGSDVVTGNWYTPTTTSIGNSYWIRWTVNSVVGNFGAGNYYDPGSSGWESLATQKSFGVATGANNLIRNIAVTYLIEIASDSGGSTIVTSALHTLQAEVSSAG